MKNPASLVKVGSIQLDEKLKDVLVDLVDEIEILQSYDYQKRQALLSHSKWEDAEDMGETKEAIFNLAARLKEILETE